MRKKSRKIKNSAKILEKERTLLADERTLLSFIRTALSIFIFAIFIYKFFPTAPYIFQMFILTIFIGIVVLLIGFFQYLFFKKEADRI